MATMFFGQYLLAKAAINREALLYALERQRHSNLSLPELAVQQGLIDRSQANSIMVFYRMSNAPIEIILEQPPTAIARHATKTDARLRSSIAGFSVLLFGQDYGHPIRNGLAVSPMNVKADRN